MLRSPRDVDSVHTTAAQSASPYGRSDREPAKLDATVAAITSAGGRCHAVVMDMLSVASVRVAVRSAVDTMGGLDVLVNNAGLNTRQPMLEETEEARHMKDAGGGVIDPAE